ncbi:MAG: polyurethanase [Piscirickettsiaceae bacterium]|jgi:sigma-E factor negative regulatory protein RseC|nr:polyurethanase [Piscirickettsiaceae bacterium]
MIEQQATVIEIKDDMVWLQAERQSTCSQCQIKQGCGTGLLAKHVGQRFSKITVQKTTDVSVGQQVTVEIPEQTLLQGAALMYLLPLGLLFVFSMTARALVLGEVIEIIMGLIGLVIGFTWTRQRLKNNKDGFQASVREE